MMDVHHPVKWTMEKERSLDTLLYFYFLSATMQLTDYLFSGEMLRLSCLESIFFA